VLARTLAVEDRFVLIHFIHYSNLAFKNTIMTDYNDLPNVASPLLGASIVFATDEWFAAAGQFDRL
jgi:hypothetical protein